ncbi:MAG: flagellar basal body L-ring protein FlgH [Planctomycetota bacterium]|nr:MAG: flagellar basal body L-ring protein FlgH [Planctomycetota bacterium]
MNRATLCGLLLYATAPSAAAQSLFLVDHQAADTAPGVISQPAIDASRVSLLWVPEPEKRIFQKHDIITIVVDEVSSQTSSQKLETDKKSDVTARLDAMLNYMALLELRLDQGDTSGLDLIGFSADRKFTGEGDYERKDKFSARITATVLEVKPNGNLVLEATKRIAKDDEIQTFVLSGVVREDDITRQNTVLSSQMANLNVVVKNEGELRDAAKKGFITEIFEALFAF